MATTPGIRKNALLAALPKAAQERLAPDLELVDMPLGKALYEPGEKLSHAYFPTESIIAQVYVSECGESMELSMVGNEGMIGLYLFMGGGVHNEPGDRAERRPRLPAASAGTHGRIQPR